METAATFSFTADDPLSLRRTDSADPDFRLLVSELDADLRERNGELMDIYDAHNALELIDTVLVAYYEGELAGCGCFKKYNDESAEIKRMFVRPGFRGKHIAYRLLDYLIGMAHRQRYRYAILETGSKQSEAFRLYIKSGFVLTDNYPPYIGLGDSICFSRLLYLEQGSQEAIIREAYNQFNQRNISRVLAYFHPEADWPNGWEGGYVKGHAAIRDFWQRQWLELDPEVRPVGFKRLRDGRLEVKVRQAVENLDGVLLFSGLVYHIYTFRDGLVSHMEIREFI